MTKCHFRGCKATGIVQIIVRKYDEEAKVLNVAVAVYCYHHLKMQVQPVIVDAVPMITAKYFCSAKLEILIDNVDTTIEFTRTACVIGEQNVSA